MLDKEVPSEWSRNKQDVTRREAKHRYETFFNSNLVILLVFKLLLASWKESCKRYKLSYKPDGRTRTEVRCFRRRPHHSI